MYSYTTAINLLISIPLEWRTSPCMLDAGKWADGESTQLSLWRRKIAKTGSSDVKTSLSSISLLGQSQQSQKALAMPKCLHFFVIKTAFTFLNKKHPQLLLWLCTQLSSSKLRQQGNNPAEQQQTAETQHDRETDCIPLENTCSLKT